MENRFFLKNSIEKIERGKNSFFLDPKEKAYVLNGLRKRQIPYQLYTPYEEAEKVLIYSGKFPEIELLEIVSKELLSHRSILGTLFAHQILPYFYSDIIITATTHYLVALKPVANYLKDHVREIGKIPVQFVKRELANLGEYHPSYEMTIYHVSSLRLDTVIAKIIKKSRSSVEEVLDEKEVFLNYEVVTKKDIVLKEGDIFSIRGYGKYRFSKVQYQNKKGNLDIEILKYK